jgi:hypothetical protein
MDLCIEHHVRKYGTEPPVLIISCQDRPGPLDDGVCELCWSSHDDEHSGPYGSASGDEAEVHASYEALKERVLLAGLPLTPGDHGDPYFIFSAPRDSDFLSDAHFYEIAL